MKSIQYLLATVALAALLTLAGCFSQTGLPLEIVTITPALNASDVLINSTITIAASAEIDAATATADSIRLLKGSPTAGTEVATGVTVSAESITITPTAALDFGTQYTVVIAGTVADTDGNLLSGEVSWGFTTRPLLVSVTTTGGQLVAGARITVAGSYVGTTNGAGQLPVSWPSGGSAAVAATKKFFLPTSDPSIPLDGTSYDAQLEVSPYIFVPTVPVVAAPSIIRLDAVDAAPASFVSIMSVNHGAGPATYTLAGPRWIEVDYRNGAIYIVDAATSVAAATLIKLTNYPPAADGSEAQVVGLTAVSGTQQMHLNTDGSLVLVDFRFTAPNLLNGRLVQLPADLNYTAAVFGPWNSAFMYGVTRIASGQYLTIGGDASVVDALLFDDVSDLVPDTFGTSAYGMGANQMQLPSRVISPAGSSVVYVSDTGEDLSSYHNDRIVRYNSNGTGFAAYGSGGSTEGLFVNPVLLGVLPDNRLYIMDVGNNRLVRINPAVFDGGAADWTESDALATFNFTYWYHYS